MTRVLGCLLLAFAAATAGCNKASDPPPNPELKAPVLPAGRAAPGADGKGPSTGQPTMPKR